MCASLAAFREPPARARMRASPPTTDAPRARAGDTPAPSPQPTLPTLTRCCAGGPRGVSRGACVPAVFRFAISEGVTAPALRSRLVAAFASSGGGDRRAVANFKDRYSALNLGTSTTQLRDFLQALGNEPYRDFVEYRLKDLSTRELQDAAIDDLMLGMQLLGKPYNLEQGARISAVLRARFLVDPSYWVGSTARRCAEALPDVVGVFEEELSLGDVSRKSVEQLDDQQQRALFSLFGFATDLFAGHASESKLIRSNMGLRKGLFG